MLQLVTKKKKCVSIVAVSKPYWEIIFNDSIFTDFKLGIYLNLIDNNVNLFKMELYDISSILFIFICS